MPTQTLFQKISEPLLDLLSPPVCLNCKAAGSWFCQNCVAEVDLIQFPVCERCGTPWSDRLQSCIQCENNPLQHLDGIRSAAYFENNPIRSAIHYLKYKNHKAVAPILGEILAEACRRFDLMTDVLIPVPLHVSRYRERGYNQSELVAEQLAKILELPVNTDTLHRIRKTKSQMQLGAGERHRNVMNAFSCSNGELSGRSVLIIDDVCTTGSTLDACADALKQSGVAVVWGVTLARSC